MIFFYFVAELALSRTCCAAPNEHTVRFSRNFERNMENIWNLNSFLIDQNDFKNAHDTIHISNRTLFVRKHEKFFQIFNISITKQFLIKTKIRTHHGEHIKPVCWSPFKNFSFALYEKYIFYKISKIKKSKSTDVITSTWRSSMKNFKGYEDISYPIYSYIKKDRKVGFLSNPTFYKSEITQNNFLGEQIRIRNQKVTHGEKIVYNFFSTGKVASLQRTIFMNFSTNIFHPRVFSKVHISNFLQMIQHLKNKVITHKLLYRTLLIISLTIYTLQKTIIEYQNIIRYICFAYIMLLSIICNIT